VSEKLCDSFTKDLLAKMLPKIAVQAVNSPLDPILVVIVWTMADPKRSAMFVISEHWRMNRWRAQKPVWVPFKY